MGWTVTLSHDLHCYAEGLSNFNVCTNAFGQSIKGQLRKSLCIVSG